MVNYNPATSVSQSFIVQGMVLQTVFSVNSWAVPYPGAPVTITGAVSTNELGRVPAGLHLQIGLIDPDGVNTYVGFDTDASGSFSQAIVFPKVGTWSMRLFQPEQQTLGGAVFNPGVQYEHDNFTVVEYPTTLVIGLYNGNNANASPITSAMPGDNVWLYMSLEVTGGSVFANMVIPVVITPASGSAISINVNTGPSGASYTDLSADVAAATSGEFGTWSIDASYAGTSTIAAATASVSLTVSAGSSNCTSGQTRCYNNVSQVCQNNAWSNGGSACSSFVLPDTNTLILIGGLAGLAIIGVALVASGGKTENGGGNSG